MKAKLRALILEDERPARNYLVELLHDTGRAVVVAAVANAEEASAAIRERPSLGVDVAFVDVRLSGSHASGTGAKLTGLDWMQTIVEEPSAPRFVLTTASAEYAMAGYALGVVDYLLKPFTSERVERTVQRLIDLREEPVTVLEHARVVARRGRSLRFLEFREIYAFEADARLTFVHTETGRFDLDLSLAALETSFAGMPLLRTHRNWLVYTPAIVELELGERMLVVGRGEHACRVPIARDRATEVRERLFASAVGIRRGT